VLTRHSELDSTTLRRAITATFVRRATALPTTTPIGLADEFSTNATRQTQWWAFVTKNRLDAPSLPQVIAHIRTFFESTLRILA
jgi:hypothetical protein